MTLSTFNFRFSAFFCVLCASAVQSASYGPNDMCGFTAPGGTFSGPCSQLDANGDGQVDNADYLLVIHAIADHTLTTSPTCPPCPICPTCPACVPAPCSTHPAEDVNGDGIIDSVDVQQVARASGVQSFCACASCPAPRECEPVYNLRDMEDWGIVQRCISGPNTLDLKCVGQACRDHALASQRSERATNDQRWSIYQENVRQAQAACVQLAKILGLDPSVCTASQPGN